MSQRLEERPNITPLHLRDLAHCALSFGSVGQLVCLERYHDIPLKRVKIPLIRNTVDLYSLSSTSPGILVTKTPTAEPSPTLTRRVGRAQQTRVLLEANKLRYPPLKLFMI